MRSVVYALTEPSANSIVPIELVLIRVTALHSLQRPINKSIVCCWRRSNFLCLRLDLLFPQILKLLICSKSIFLRELIFRGLRYLREGCVESW